MTEPPRPSLMAPSLRKIVARTGAAFGPRSLRRRAAAQPDEAIIEGQAEAVPSDTMADAAARAYGPMRGAPRRSDPDMSEAPPERGFRLVRQPVDLTDGKMVEEFLPDILGRALARSWVDPVFRQCLTEDPKALLADHDVHLPGSIRIETQIGANGRPLVVVHERRPDGGMRRLCYLQLVMLAGK